jgi:hypothetical protein
MFRFNREPMKHVITFRVTDSGDAALEQMRKHLRLDSKTDVLRAALDFFAENAPDLAPLRKGRPPKKES